MGKFSENTLKRPSLASVFRVGFQLEELPERKPTEFPENLDIHKNSW
jgi:hypothetical protein